MRKPLLLLTSTTLALLLACGVAMAATAIDCALVGNPCNGTEGDDQITGTDPSAIATGKDTINGLGGDDQISALGGNDNVTGGTQNDTMDGGMGKDSYRFGDSFGADRIEADSSGVDTVDFSPIGTPIGTLQYANGIAVDLVGPDPPCDPTLTSCLSLGGGFIENAVGTRFGDQLTGNASNNTLRGGDDSLSNNVAGPDGFDRLNGGAGNDRLLGGGNDDPYDGTNDYAYTSSFDFYHLTPNWGKDTIVDSGGAHDRVMPVDNTTAASMPPLTVNLVSDPNRPEVKDGTGDTVNWEGNVVDDAVTGDANDKISQNSSDNDLYGGLGSDTYRGNLPGGVGGDLIIDRGGAGDVLDLSSFSLADTGLGSFTTGSGSTTNRYLRIRLNYYFCSGYPCDVIDVSNYFDNTGTDKCAANPGTGAIETIKFAGGVSVDFAQAKHLVGCP